MARRHVLGFLLWLAAPAGATEFYVDPASGSDAGDGSAAHPWRTLKAVVEAHLIETRNWESLPYQPGKQLATVNAGAPVKAGDTLWLRTGYHGAVVISGAYNALPITVAAQSGHSPRLGSLLVRSAQSWVFRGLSVSPSHAPPLSQITIVSIEDHNWTGPAWDIVLDDSDIFTVADASAWGAAQWIDVASSGVSVSADRVTVRGCRVRNVRFGISVSGDAALVRENLIDGFSADGLRGLGDDGTFEYNRVQNNYVTSAQGDSNHDDGFQSWSVGAGGVGTGEVRGVTLRGNVFINHVAPSHPLRSTMQAIGCYDGLFAGWLVENNVVITDHWHGISFYGMRDSRIVNNTVVDIDQVSPGPPWIMVTAHKDGRPSRNVVVRNNLATDFSLQGDNVVGDHNIELTSATLAAFFVAAPYDLHLRPATAAVDSGNPDLAPAFDVERVPRPQGPGFDLGAYERVVPTLSIDDVTIPEGHSGTTSAVFTVSLSASSTATVTVGFATANGTGVAGVDYGAASGVLTLPPGTTTRTVSVPVLGNLLDEDDRTFVVNLSGALNAPIGDAQGLGTIRDDDPAPELSVGDCSVTEGSGAGVGCVFDVELGAPSRRTVTLSYATASGTAAAGGDFTAASGTLTFAPLATARTVSVVVLGDTSDEPNERFYLNLFAVANATVRDGQGTGTILDDDGVAITTRELGHGFSGQFDLASRPGPVADEDIYVLLQGPYSSHEVVVDDVSGDLGALGPDGGPEVALLGADGLLVRQAVAVGVGPARSLRMLNSGPHATEPGTIRVRSGGCTTGCGPDDVYRIRVHETTCAVPRFNNAGSQTTVLILQNRGAEPISGTVYFWSAAGTLVGSSAIWIAARSTQTLNTKAVAGVSGKSGGITVAHDGPYGALTGKAVALEPATGFSFDSPMTPRP